MDNNEKNLSDLLLEMGLLAPEQLVKALAIQKKTGERLEKIVIHEEYITEEDLMKALKFQIGVPYVNLSSVDESPDVANLIPFSLAERYLVVPIRKDGKRLTLAMADPTNIFAVDDVRLASGCHVDVVAASEYDIKQIIEQSYGVHDLIQKAVKQVVKEDSVPLVEPEIADDTPVISIVNSIINEAVKNLASDIHIEPLQSSVRVRYRIDGILRQVLELPLYLHAALISRIKIMSEMDIAEKRIPQDGRIQLKESDKQIDVRVSTLPTICGEKVVMRILDKATIQLDIKELGFSKENFANYTKLYHQPYGMLLITGPTGSGKTTTLYSTLTELSVPGKNVITIEDPVEYQLDGVNQVQVNPKAGMSFASGLRSILRQDPNIVMVGEIRDAETAEIAIRAALTGHLVLSTLHTNDAPGAITRLIDMGIEPFLITASVLGVVAQRLVRSICPDCKKAYTLQPGSREKLFLSQSFNEIKRLYKGEGCVRCGHTGYKGRVAVHEVMIVSQEMREAIHRRATADELAAIAASQGMIRIREDGMFKALQGLTTIAEVMRLTFADS